MPSNAMKISQLEEKLAAMREAVLERWTREQIVRQIPVADIVEAASFLLSDRCPTMTGETVNVAAGIHMRY